MWINMGGSNSEREKYLTMKCKIYLLRSSLKYIFNILMREQIVSDLTVCVIKKW